MSLNNVAGGDVSNPLLKENEVCMSG